MKEFPDLSAQLADAIYCGVETMWDAWELDDQERLTDLDRIDCYSGRWAGVA